jgi:two-component system cell cycle sensor histidine kinase/response regulator CckA
MTLPILPTDESRRPDALPPSDEQRISLALQNAGVGIWEMDCRTGRLTLSAATEAHHGLEPGTFEGTQDAFVERVHPADRRMVLHVCRKALASGETFSIEYRTIWPDGSVRWVARAGRIMLGALGEPVHGAGTSMDVTSRRALEEQTHQAEKMEAVGRLAGGVAHDFNNLLTAILGYCELLLETSTLSEPDRADVLEIQNAGGRAAGLTRQLLAFSRKQIIEPKLLGLNALVSDIRPTIERLIGEDIELVVSLRPSLPAVSADRGQAEQVVMNLAANARDAMPQGGTLTIETASVALDEHDSKTHPNVKEGSYVVLTVSDTGTGMTPEVQARLFEPFFTTKEPGKGTGMSMATVHGIVMRCGGSVSVNSELGKGTTFKVYFPSADVTEGAAEAASSARLHFGGETVLLVEDSEGLRELAQRLLARQGYTVIAAGSAEEALRLFDENVAIDLVLTDVVMPGASGPALAKQLLERRPKVKVVYMSGYTEDVITQHGVLQPGIAFLHKPFTSDTLGRKIRDVLDAGLR